MDIIIEHGTRKVTQDELSFNGTEQIKELLKIIEGEATIMFLLTTRIGWVKKKESVLRIVEACVLLVLGVLFAVYFWNLDQKLMAWAYTQVNNIFDRKKQDLNF